MSSEESSVSSSPELVVPRIFAAIDDRRFGDLHALYDEDVHATTAVGEIAGRASLVGTLQAIHDPIPVLQHSVSGVIVDDLEGDTASVRANVVAFFGDEHHEPLLEGSSIWRGRLHRTDGHWRIAEVAIETVWTRGQMPTA